MTATYTNQPGVRAIDTVRYEVDDRDTIPETDAALSDEEIQYLLDTNKSVLFAAAAAAESIGGQYATEGTSEQVGDLEIDYGDGTSATYAALAKRIRTRAAKQVVPFAGGLTKSGHETAAKDTDRVQPEFTIGMDDNVTSGSATDRGILEY